MPKLKDFHSPFEGYVGEVKGRGGSTAKVSDISNSPGQATATPSRGAQVNLFVVKPKADDKPKHLTEIEELI